MKSKRHVSPFLAAAALVVVTITVCPAAAVDVSTGFTDGNGTSTPDQFVGTAGDGWTAAWSGTGTSSNVISTTPIDVGNYLSVTRSGGASTAIRRQFDLNAGDMVSGSPYDVEWTWRFDGDISQMTVYDDRIHFFGDSSAIAGSGGTNSWLIGVVSAWNGSSGFDGGNFYFYRNTGSSAGSFSESQMINTGVPLNATTAGDVFKFKVIVDPSHGTYDATIRNTNSGATFTAANMKFRNATTNAATTNYLHFGNNADSSSDNTTFSLDTIQMTAHHKIVANFDDLNTPNTIDTFNNASAGGGWAGAWGISGSGISGTVATSNPLNNAGDPYLAVTLVNPVSENQDNVVRRQFEDFGLVDIDKAHLVSWKWRFDGNLDDFTDAGDDRIHFFADHNTQGGTGSSNSWIIGVTSDRGGFVNDEFYFFDGSTSNSFSGSNTVPTGIALQEDVVYAFDVWVNPDSKSYSARITDEFGNTFYAAGLKFRNYTTSATGVTWDRLHFGAAINGLGDDLSFSLDSITISQVPEPTTVTMVVTGLLMLGLAGWRRRRRA